MAESTYDRYERLRDLNNAGFRKLEQRIEEAVELTELLQDVAGRVKAFVEAYEEELAPTRNLIREQREKGTTLSTQVADLAEKDLQTLVAGPVRTKKPDRDLRLDDLKILLDYLTERQQTDIRF